MMKKRLSFFVLVIVMLLGVSSSYGQSTNLNPIVDTASGGVSLQKKRILNPLSVSPSQKIIKRSSAAQLADFSKFEGRTIYGNLVYTNAWSGLADYEIPYGFYSYTIDDSEEPEFTPLLTDLGYGFMAGAYARGKFYGVRPVSIFGALTAVFYNIINTESWTEETEKLFGDMSSVTYDLLASSMAYDATNNKIYALQYNEDLTGLYWSVFNKETLSFDILVRWKGTFDVLALVGTPNGNIYCIGTDGDFYSVNKETGSPSLIGSTDIAPTMYSQSATYDGKTGTILWNAITANGSSLYSIDISTGKASFLRDLPDGQQIVGMYLLDNEAVINAPAAINDLKISYAQAGGLNATIDFTIPSKTYSGESLGGNVNLIVWADGEIVKEESVAAGTKFNIPYEFSNDNHYIAISTTNTAGMAPYTNTYFYSGYDTPKAVSDLNFTLEDGNSTVTWNAPIGGINDGYIDPAALYYKVYRFPGNILVTDNLKETSFSETLPTEMQNYYYTVVPYNGASKEGISASSNIINYGIAFPIPYIETFTGVNPINLFAIYDNNNDGVTWQYNDWSKDVQINTSVSNSAANCDDWLITPRVRLEANKKYRLTFATRGYATNYVENMRVYIGTDPEDINSFNTVLTDIQDMAIYEFTDQFAEFSIPTNGDYAIGFYVYSEKAKSSLIRINKIAVDEIGNIGAPDAVSELEVVRGDNDAMTATISFISPTKSLNDEDIDGLSKIYVYRGEETNPIYTFDSPATGTSLSWTDDNVDKAGITKYKVVAENEYGIGKYAEASNFIGVYTAPYLETFDTSEARSLYTSEITVPGSGIKDWVYDSNLQLLNITNFCMETGEFRLYTPAVKLDAEGVYQLSFLYKNTGYGKTTFYTTKGMNPTAEAQTVIDEIPSAYASKATLLEHEFIADADGKYYLGLNIKANAQYDYVVFSIDSISVKRISSAKAPGIVEDLSVEADEAGALSATLSFKASTSDYAGRTLSSISKIDIFRGNNSIPVKSFSNPQPGDILEWTDTEPLHGNNTYMIVATNEFGTSKAVKDTVFVGKDIPSAVTRLKIMTDATNQIPTLTWTAPAIGINGGFLDTESLTYTILEYNATTQNVSIIASNVRNQSYTVETETKLVQDVYYYGVVPFTNEGQGALTLSYVTLGSLFQLPFTESFANAVSGTEPWITNAEQTYAYWTPTASFNNGIDPQDNDGGMLVFYNSGYNTIVKGDLTSPKIAINGKNATLTFWLYQGITPAYETIIIPYLNVGVSTDNSEFVPVYDNVYTNVGDGWTEHTIDLSEYKNASFLQFRFNAASAGSRDIIYVDNVSLNYDESGITNDAYNSVAVYAVENGIIIKGAEGKAVNAYNTYGQTVAVFVANDNHFKTLSQGIYLIKIEGNVFKVIVK